MKSFVRIFSAACALALCLCLMPRAFGDDTNHQTLVTFETPVEVPGVGAQVLPAGTYSFKLLDSLSDRHIVQISSEDGSHVYTTILAIPNYRLRTTDKTVMTFQERKSGQPEALRAWFYPGREWGDEFVYPQDKALQLAKAVNQRVLTTTVVTTTVTSLKTAPIEAIKPTGEAVAVAEAVEQAPASAPAQVAETTPAPEPVVASSEPASEPVVAAAPKMPKTASSMPLLACFGLLSLGAGLLLSKRTI